MSATIEQALFALDSGDLNTYEGGAEHPERVYCVIARHIAQLTAERDALKAELAGAREALSRSQAECAMRHFHRGVAEKRLTELREATLAMRALGIPIHGSNQEYEELWAAAAKVDAVLAKLTP